MAHTSTVHSVELPLAGRILKLEVNRFHTQATGSVTASLGDTVILATAGIADKPRPDMDFFPLMVDFEERYYATGKIKGSRFIKREGRPSENAILSARLIDRPLRPLFPDGMVNDVQIICTVLSADMEVDPATTGLTAASAALMVSGVPFAGPVAGVRVGLVTDASGKEQLILNPTYEQTDAEKGARLNLVVAGTKTAITMIEAQAAEVPEELMLQAFELAHQHIKQLCEMQERLRDMVKPPEYPYVKVREKNEDAKKAVEGFVKEEMLRRIGGTSKKDFKDSLAAVKKEVLEHFASQIAEGKFSEGQLGDFLLEMREKLMRKDILAGKARIDGRMADDIRPLGGAIDVLPRPHGSGLFIRGETEVLTLTTLGGPGDAQIIDTMDMDVERFYIHHYNFPPFSVGEVKPMRGTGRREIGHGDLAERALLAVLPSRESFPYTMRLVSEVLSCNGSSSMASVCGSSLSLMAAGVPIKSHVGGIAMGLVASDDYDGGAKGSFVILTDIQGLEDFAGDMDFKVTGTAQGITAMQMDIKLTGVGVELLRQALQKGRAARLKVLDHLTPIIPAPRKELSKYAPLILTIQIETDQIRDVIGRGGETIQKICAECDVKIDIEDDGLVMITAPDQEKGRKAQTWVQRITYIPQVGDVFDGTVTRIMDFGAFVEFVPGKDGLVHISQLDKNRVNKVTDIVNVGDPLKVKLMEIDDQGRYNLSHKALL